jgi:hypothetical protein
MSPVYKAKERKPETCGASPRRIVVEVRKTHLVSILTYWYYWEYDNFPGDHEDWEPISLLYDREELREIYARVHEGLVRYVPQAIKGRPYVFFNPWLGHTPVIKVASRNSDITLYKMNDRKDDLRQKWLDLSYARGALDNWSPTSQPPLESVNPPNLDMTSWKSWGKHSIYLII